MEAENHLPNAMDREKIKNVVKLLKYKIMPYNPYVNGQNVPSSGLEEERRTTTKKQNPPTPAGRAHA